MRRRISGIAAGLLLASLTARSEGMQNAQAAPPPESGGSITLEECRALALERSFDLAAARAEVKAAEGAWRQVRAWPNPEIAVEVEDFGGDLPRWSDSQTTYLLNQRLESPAKRAAASEVGRWGAEGAKEELERARRDLTAEVERRFAELLAAQERRQVWQETALVCDSLTGAVAALVRAGEVSSVEEERARVDRSLAEIELQNAEAELDKARYALSALWGQAEPSFRQARGELKAALILPPAERLCPDPSGLPDLRWWETEVKRLQAAVRRERRSRLPDLNLGAGLRHLAATSARTYLASLSLEIPLFDRNGGAIEEAESRVRQRIAAKRAAEARIRAELFASYRALESALAQARTIRTALLPQAEEVYRALQEGYRRGKFGLLDALDARRALAAASLRAVEGGLAVALARVDLERRLGYPLSQTEGETR